MCDQPTTAVAAAVGAFRRKLVGVKSTVMEEVMSFTLKSQPMFSSHCLSARFTLLSRRRPVNVIVSKPVSFTLRLTLLALLLGTASLLFGRSDREPSSASSRKSAYLQ